MHQPHTIPTQNTIVNKILQVALGLFVTTTDLPHFSSFHQNISYDCSFDKVCRWSSTGNNYDNWRVARGEPDSLLWLAATGTMQMPREPFALIESRGNPVDALMTDEIHCQKGFAELSFTYWIIGTTDIEICLANGKGEKFNCTGELNSSVMPGKVSLKVPELQESFRIMIQPNLNPGVIILDDLRYDANLCDQNSSTLRPFVKRRPDFSITESVGTVQPWEFQKSTVEPSRNHSYASSTPSETSTESYRKTTPNSATDSPFDLLIIGNRTRPLKDRRTGKIIENPSDLLCDFDMEFACRWGPENGRWAIVDSGAIPSLEDTLGDSSLFPTFPAALVLQGVTMLTSDPLPCQTGDSKVLFRYWSNGGISLQVCAIGHGDGNGLTHCFQHSQSEKNKTHILGVFEINIDIDEPFTLNIVPQWEDGQKNKFLLIDEIAYIGSCKSLEKNGSLPEQLPTVQKFEKKKIELSKLEMKKPTTDVSGKSVKNTKDEKSTKSIIESTEEAKTSLPGANKKKRTWLTTFSPLWSTAEFTKTINIQKHTMKPWTTTHETKRDDYCDILNCNFEDTACNYLNHGLTKKPWTLRNRGYGYPLTGTSDIRATETNNQFVSVILDAGDIAILESPKFNATSSLNVLLFQYFRPSHMTTIRFCLGSQYTNPMRTVSSFAQCPSILRSVTSKNAYRWNTVHLQIPPGTTHFCLVAHSSEKSTMRSAIAIDNMRVAICDAKGFAPDYIDETSDFQNV